MTSNLEGSGVNGKVDPPGAFPPGDAVTLKTEPTSDAGDPEIAAPAEGALRGSDKSLNGHSDASERQVNGHGTNGANGHGGSNGHVNGPGPRIAIRPGQTVQRLIGDAREIPISDDTVDLVVTSPPYWKKRDYGVEDQIGQEPTYQGYVDAMVDCLREWRRVLRGTGSVFLNIGDTFHNRRLAGIPARVEMAAADDGWIVRNRIIWAKDGGMPEAVKNRLASRHEYIMHLTLGHDYYYDLFGYSAAYGNGANPGDVWRINPRRHMGEHLAPFPTEIAERAILLACPERICSHCGAARRRIVERTTELDPKRPQAKRAMELAKTAGLSEEHLRAVQATGVSDAGKALKTQNGTGRNSDQVKILAAEAKEALGGYFREFTFAKRITTGWTTCGCRKRFEPGVVLDPFMGTGTTLETARTMGRSAIGIDLAEHPA